MVGDLYLVEGFLFGLDELKDVKWELIACNGWFEGP